MRLLLFFLFLSISWGADIRVAYVGPTDDSAWKGAQLGIDEANVLGRFTGQIFTLEVVPPEQADGGWSGIDPVVVVAVADSESLLALSEKLAPRGIAVLNVSNSDDELRAECRRNLLHVAPSEKMKAGAVAQWRKQHPGAAVAAQAWHPDFVKFAARDLNKRYRAKFDEPMDDHAWAGWAAVKMTADAVARTPEPSAGAVLEFLREELEFDANKGAAHTFRETGQLRQPLLLVEEGGKLLGEAPVRGVAASDDLDSLGLAQCR